MNSNQESDAVQAGVVTGSPSGTITTLEAVVLKADGTRVDLGVVATSDPDRAPLTQRSEEK